MSNENLLGHPKGLFLLFSTEMWERMSYYGLRGVLVLYLSTFTTASVMGWDMSHFGIAADSSSAQQEYNLALQANALSYLGSFVMMTFIAPIIGMWAAQNFWGKQKAINIGALLMMLGHFALAIPYHWIPGFEVSALLLGLMLLIFGSGFFKPNVSSLVSELYQGTDKRRESGFSLLYMGVNFGAILGYMIIGTVAEKVNYQYGFFIAGIAMAIALITQLMFARKNLGSKGLEPENKRKEFHNTPVIKPLSIEEKDRLKTILVMAFFTIVFWTGFEQAAGYMNLYAKYQVDLTILGWEMPASWLQAVNPLFILIFAPMVAGFFINKGDKEPNAIVKTALALLFLGLGFIAMAMSAYEITITNSKAAMMWLILAYALHTLGELCMSPINLTLLSKLAPIKYVSLLTAGWFLVSGLSNKLASVAGEVMLGTGPLTGFLSLSVVTFVAGVALWLFSNKLIVWLHGFSLSAALNDEEKLEQEFTVVGMHEGIQQQVSRN